MKVFLIAILLIACAGCEPKKLEKNVWDDQTKALEKARDVEDQLMQRADQLNKDLSNQLEQREDPPE